MGVTPAELLHADLRGPIALILGSASWALGTVLAKRLRLKVPVTLSSAAQMFAGGALMLGAGLASREQVPASIAPEADCGVRVPGRLRLDPDVHRVHLPHAQRVADGGGHRGVHQPRRRRAARMAHSSSEPITARTLLAMGIILSSVLLIQLGTRPATKEQAADKWCRPPGGERSVVMPR